MGAKGSRSRQGYVIEMTTLELRDLLRRDVVAAAPALLGGMLVSGELRARIVETEAYRADEPACHAFGKTKMKNMLLFGEPGLAYVYFNYGVHWMLNITAHEHGYAAGILIRAAQPLDGLEIMRERRRGVADRQLLSGPGKLAQAFAISAEDNGKDLLDRTGLHIVPPSQPVTNIQTGPRIGIAEGKAHELPWRFVDRDLIGWATGGK